MGEINYLLGKDRKKIIVLVLFFLVLTLLDLAGLGLITPYISIILNEEMNFKDNVTNDYFLKYFNDCCFFY